MATPCGAPARHPDCHGGHFRKPRSSLLRAARSQQAYYSCFPPQVKTEGQGLCGHPDGMKRPTAILPGPRYGGVEQQHAPPTPASTLTDEASHRPAIPSPLPDPLGSSVTTAINPSPPPAIISTPPVNLMKSHIFCKRGADGCKPRLITAFRE